MLNIEAVRFLFEKASNDILKALETHRSKDKDVDAYTHWATTSKEDLEQEDLAIDDLIEKILQNPKDQKSVDFDLNITIEAFKESLRAFPSLFLSLKNEQRLIFNEIYNDLVNINRFPSFSPRQFFVHGGGGVGKSHLIKAIVSATNDFASKQHENLFKSRVAVCALTGVAAFNVDGTVIDSTFNMPRKYKTVLQKMSGAKLAEM